MRQYCESQPCPYGGESLARQIKFGHPLAVMPAKLKSTKICAGCLDNLPMVAAIESYSITVVVRCVYYSQECLNMLYLGNQSPDVKNKLVSLYLQV